MAKSLGQLLDSLGTKPSAEEELRLRTEIDEVIKAFSHRIHTDRTEVLLRLEEVLAMMTEKTPPIVVTGVKYAIHALVKLDNDPRLAGLEAEVMAKSAPDVARISDTVARCEESWARHADELRRRGDVCVALSGGSTAALSGSSVEMLVQLALRSLMLRELRMVLDQKLVQERRN